MNFSPLWSDSFHVYPIAANDKEVTMFLFLETRYTRIWFD